MSILKNEVSYFLEYGLRLNLALLSSNSMLMPGQPETLTKQLDADTDPTKILTKQLQTSGSKVTRMPIFFGQRFSVSAQDGIVALGRRSHKGCHRNNANVCLVEHRSFSASEVGMSAASFLHSTFFQAINAVMLWSVHVHKVPQVCPFIPIDSGMPRAEEPQKYAQLKTIPGPFQTAVGSLSQ